jgi:hypothetical protein
MERGPKNDNPAFRRRYFIEPGSSRRNGFTMCTIGDGYINHAATNRRFSGVDTRRKRRSRRVQEGRPGTSTQPVHNADFKRTIMARPDLAEAGNSQNKRFTRDWHRPVCSCKLRSRKIYSYKARCNI